MLQILYNFQVQSKLLWRIYIITILNIFVCIKIYVNKHLHNTHIIHKYLKWHQQYLEEYTGGNLCIHQQWEYRLGHTFRENNIPIARIANYIATIWLSNCIPQYILYKN